MSTATQQKTIDGRSCTVVQYPGMEGLRIWTNLIKILGPSLALLGKGFGDSIKDFKTLNEVGKILDNEVDITKLFSSISEALVMATGNINEDIAAQLVLRMLSGTKIDNEEINGTSFNLMFCGNYGLLFKLLAFVLKVNYSSFLGDRGLSIDTAQNLSLSSVPASMMKT